mmetsp:Transcript_16422/g.24091  ORF Transcript_16422/g.24091 Transcript_16422/m.24091 type:complete len:228 (-) Transcript_16422:498-1181(-)
MLSVETCAARRRVVELGTVDCDLKVAASFRAYHATSRSISLASGEVIEESNASWNATGVITPLTLELNIFKSSAFICNTALLLLSVSLTFSLRTSATRSVSASNIRSSTSPQLSTSRVTKTSLAVASGNALARSTGTDFRTSWSWSRRCKHAFRHSFLQTNARRGSRHLRPLRLLMIISALNSTKAYTAMMASGTASKSTSLSSLSSSALPLSSPLEEPLLGKYTSL